MNICYQTWLLVAVLSGLYCIVGKFCGCVVSLDEFEGSADVFSVESRFNHNQDLGFLVSHLKLRQGHLVLFLSCLVFTSCIAPSLLQEGVGTHLPPGVCVHGHACILLAYPFRSADISSSARVSAVPGENTHPPKGSEYRKYS